MSGVPQKAIGDCRQSLSRLPKMAVMMLPVQACLSGARTKSLI